MKLDVSWTLRCEPYIPGALPLDPARGKRPLDPQRGGQPPTPTGALPLHPCRGPTRPPDPQRQALGGLDQPTPGALRQLLTSLTHRSGAWAPSLGTRVWEADGCRASQARRTPWGRHRTARLQAWT